MCRVTIQLLVTIYRGSNLMPKHILLPTKYSSRTEAKHHSADAVNYAFREVYRETSYSAYRVRPVVTA